MKLEFWKYHGNGNDFIILDKLPDAHQIHSKDIAQLCDRHFGIGADGLMMLDDSKLANFKMSYFNADGRLASLCGNGGRCIAQFAYLKKIAPREMTIEAYDGIHHAIVEDELAKGKKYSVSLQMANVTVVERNRKFYFLDTGSPHYVEFVNGLAEMDVVKEGKNTRYSERFSADGTNVNFVEIRDDSLFVRTYERGVEDETLSCGTGVTAASIATFLETGRTDFPIQTTGGSFRVSFQENRGEFTNIWLHGPAEMVFKGEIEI